MEKLLPENSVIWKQDNTKEVLDEKSATGRSEIWQNVHRNRSADGLLYYACESGQTLTSEKIILSIFSISEENLIF